jgi:hypothetical protein
LVENSTNLQNATKNWLEIQPTCKTLKNFHRKFNQLAKRHEKLVENSTNLQNVSVFG